MQAPVRRRFTIIEAAVVATLVLLLGIIAVPLLRDNGLGKAQAQELLAVQDAVRRYYFDTQAYPTLGPASSEGSAVEPWQPGSLPSEGSEPKLAGIHFEATAVRLGSGAVVKLYPDYLRTRPKYAGELAADGTPRWRIDRLGNVRIELDGRSF